jgi:hypothetical protein
LSEKIKEFDSIELIDGRRVVVMEAYDDSEGYLCEDPQAIKDGKDFEDVLIDVSSDEIKRVVYVAN